MKMIDIGGQRLLLQKNEYGYTPLHIACECKASNEVIMRMIDVGGCELVMEKNKFGNTALHHACKHNASTKVIMKLASFHDSDNERIQQIVNIAIEEEALAQNRPVIYVAAEYGLKWSTRVKELAESNVDEVINGYDGSTGLRPFMVAAMGDAGFSPDLSSIYGLMKMSPY